MANFSGTGVAVVTPFQSDGSIDLDALRRIINHLIDGGIEYLVALGTTGEPATLSEAETAQVLETFFEEAAGRIRVVVGCGGYNTAEVCNRATEIQELYPDAAGLLSVSPYYNKPTQEGIYQHYRQLAATTDLPIIVYNVPGRTASNIEAATMLRMAHDFKRVVAIKEASGSVEQGMAILAEKPDDFQVLSGDDALGLAQIACGFVGVISVISNSQPRRFSDMVRAALAGDFERARTLHFGLWPQMQHNFVEGNPAGVKAAMTAQGLCRPEVRLPLVAASAGLRRKMEELVGSEE